MKKPILLSLLLVIVIHTPVHAIRKDTKLILEKLKKLEALITNLEQKVTIISTEFSSMFKKVKIIDTKVAAMTRNQADDSEGKENLLLSLQFIKEEINDLKNSIAKVNDKLMAMPVAPPPTTAPTTNDPATNNTADSSQPATVIQSPDSIYYTAYSDFLAKNYKLAIDGFKQFVRLYPKHTRTDNAIYWIGECYYTQRLFQEAINTFDEVIDKYSDGDKVMGATLKKGFALVEMGKESEGINVLKGLISQYPLSDEAKLAQRKINEIME
jgi:tol-pal system protein YbgF